MPFKIPTPYVLPIIVPDATDTSDGVMTKAQAAKLANIAGVLEWRHPTTWAQMQVLIAATNAHIVFLDDEGTGVPFVMDTPSDLDDVLLFGSSTSIFTRPKIDIVAGFDLIGPLARLNLKSILMTAFVPIYTFAPGKVPIDWLLDNAEITVVPASVGPVAVLGLGAFDNAVFLQNESSLLSSGGAQVIFEMQNNAGLTLSLINGSNVDTFLAGLAGGAVAATINAFIDATIGAFPALPVGITVNQFKFGSALNLPYAPTAGLFANPQPADVQTAMNRMAALLKTLNGGVLIP